MILYFAKINLESHIYDVYDGKTSIGKALDAIMETFKSGGQYEKEVLFKDGADINVEKILYRLHIIEKNEEYIHGYIYKDSKIHYKVFDNIKKTMNSRVVDSNEAVRFYFDVYNERIGYNTANRFGFREFLEAFQGILNSCLKTERNQYKFSVDLCMEGSTVEEITRELKQIGNIQRLKFKFKAPNPDSKELRAIQNDAEDRLSQLKNANIGTKSVIFTAAKVIGINIESEEVQEQLNEANTLHSEVDASTATKNGYVEIEAIDSYGNKHISGEKKAIKKEISGIDDFVEACKNVIKNRCLRNKYD